MNFLKKFKSDKKLNQKPKSWIREWAEAIIFAGTIVFLLKTFIFGTYYIPTASAEPNLLVGDYLIGNKLRYYFTDIKRGDYIIFDNVEFVYNKSNIINYYWQKYIGFAIPMLGLSAGPDNIVKRVIAVPGDTIEGKLEDGKPVIYLNGKKLDETEYVNPYPLILLERSVGFIDSDSLLIPSFLRKNLKQEFCTYDPKFSYQDQPFYKTNSSEVVTDFYGRPVLWLPNTPSYRQNRFTGEEESCIDVFGPIKIPEGKYWGMGDNRKNSRDARFFGFIDKSLIQGRVSFVIWSRDSMESSFVFDLIKHPIESFTRIIRWNRMFKLAKNLDLDKMWNIEQKLK